MAGRFLIESVAGAGGMGTVYQAKDLSSGRKVALKCMNERADVGRFLREVALLAEVRDSRVAAYVAHGLESGTPYLALEWLEGEDLATKLTRDGPMGLLETLELGRAVASGLAALHARGIVHRDVKPSNLFLEHADARRAKLLDFGIALGAGLARLTATGALIGTPSYMSPEQARGDVDIDARTDVFSLGCVLYEALTGRPAFAGEHAIAVLAKVVLDESPNVLDVRPSTPQEISELMSRMLAKSRDERPKDASAVLSQLEPLFELRDLTDEPLRPVRRGIGTAERRVSCVVLVSPPKVEGSRERFEASVSMDVAALGERLMVLANGALIVAVEGRGSPVDLATQAARAALVIASRTVGTPIAIATGRAELALHAISVRSMSGVDMALDPRGGLNDTIRSPRSGESVPVGEVIDRAARLLSSDGGVNTDDATHELLQGRFEFTSVGDTHVLGRERDLFELEYGLLGRSTPFLGRDADIAVLEGLIAESIEEPRSRVSLVTAPAGVGKSRLLLEVLKRVRGRGIRSGVEDDPRARGDSLRTSSAAESERSDDDRRVRVLTARGDVMTAASAFSLAGSLLRRKAGIVEGQKLDQARAKLMTALSSVSADRRSVVVEILGEIAGAPVPLDEASAALMAARDDAVVMGDAISSAWADWLEAECRQGPVVIAIEDLHWGDLPSVRLIDSTLRRLATLPLFVVATARPEVHERFPGLWAQRELCEIRISGLRRGASERIARSVLGPDAPAELVSALVDRAAGHPFLLEELLRAVSSGRALGELPDNVLAIVEARIYDFDASLRRVLRAASVLGDVFWVGGIAEILGGDAGLEAALSALEQKEVLERRASSSMHGESEYAFHHALVREAAYGMLTEDDRRLAHRLAGEWLERTGSRQPGRLASHFELGGELHRAAFWYRRAAQNALEGSDVSAAIEHAEKAIAWTDNVTAHAELEVVLAEAFFWKNELERAEWSARSAVARSKPGDKVWFEALALIMGASGQRGLNREVEKMMSLAMGAQAEPGALPAQVICISRAISQLAYGDRPASCRAGVARARALVPDPSTLEPFAAGSLHRAVAEAEGLAENQYRVAIAGLLSSAVSFEQAGAHRNACNVRLIRASLMSRQGMGVEGIAEAQRGFKDAEKLGVPFLVYLGLETLAECHAYLGDEDTAATFARRALALGGDSLRIDLSCHRILVLFLLRRGRLDEAERIAKTSVDKCPEDNALRGHCLSLLARVWIAQGKDEALGLAADAYEASMAQAAVIDSDWTLSAETYTRALLAAGRRAEARSLAEASLFRFKRALPKDPATRQGIVSQRLGPFELITVARELGVVFDPS